MSGWMMLCLFLAPVGEETVAVVASAPDHPIERLAADELARHLGHLFPGTRFRAGGADDTPTVIRVGTVDSAPEWRKRLGDRAPSAPEGYAVASEAPAGGRKTGIVLGRDPAGLLYGVYALLERLGFGFALSFDARPAPREGPFTLEGWDLAGHPLASRRIVFNWHNFISGCTGWDFEDWARWIEQSQKVGYNGVMVHAYGNNPMYTFTVEGRTKAVGYVSSSVRGRDWGNEHVNDVRRLPGGSVFDGPVLGSAPALAPEERRVEVTQALMRRVFDHARGRGVRTWFALDFDTISANPQEIISALPEADRFRGFDGWLVRPDTPAGARYYRAQAEALLAAYPRLDVLVLWRRTGKTTWTELKPENLPPSWMEEYRAHLARRPAAAGLKQGLEAFTHAKLAAAWRKALDELGRRDLPLAMGSWHFDWVPAEAEFLPREIDLLPLDYEALQGRAVMQDETRLRKISESLGDAPSRLIPILWAHHDDGTYVGRPFPPQPRLHDTLKRHGSGGFGIIHWTTRPLDLYFTHHVRQVWSGSPDETPAESARHAAERWFGPAGREAMGTYLERWWTGMPAFGRETGPRFIDRKLDAEAAAAGVRERLELLGRVDLKTLTPEQRVRHRYFADYEKFVGDFFACHGRLQSWEEATRKGDREAAREAIAAARPEAVIESYSRMVREAGLNRGEQALVSSMGLRWLPYFIGARQQSGLDALRVRFAPTQHETLAQGRATRTYFADDGGRLWPVLGAQETKRAVVAAGLVLDAAYDLRAGAGPDLKGAMPAGPYELTLHFSGDEASSFAVSGSAAGSCAVERAGTSASAVLPATLEAPGPLVLRFEPKRGRPVLTGVVLAPAIRK